MNIWALLLSLLLLGGALQLFLYGRRRAASERVLSRLDRSLQRDNSKPLRGAGLQRWLLRAGLSISPKGLAQLLTAKVALLGLILLVWGPWTAALVLLLTAMGVYGLLRWRYQRRVQRMIAQLPTLLDHCIRSLKAGRSLGDALLLAIERTEPPLGAALGSTRRGIELGLSLGELISEFAELYDRQEFYLLATSIKVNQRYGGNASGLLDNLIVVVRERERAAAQLRALTGETRISAWVLGVMPLAMGAYIFITNPDFFLGLWQDSAGRFMLFIAAGLQVLGCASLWRMLRSI